MELYVVSLGAKANDVMHTPPFDLWILVFFFHRVVSSIHHVFPIIVNYQLSIINCQLSIRFLL